MLYTISRSEDHSNITVVHNGQMYTANDQHPKFNEIVQKVILKDESALDLFNPEKFIAQAFERISERVTVANGVVYFDSEPIHNTLTDQIVRFMEQGLDFTPLVFFFEKLATNPNPESVEHLYRWLTQHNFTITSNGDFVGYKGVQKNGDQYLSINSGKAIVNGQTHQGYIPNNIGDIVEMPRNQVEFDPGVGCSTGLHAGSWSYASSFARGAVLEVHINPRDVVSVPTDCSDQKLRTCRYVVVNVIEQEYDTAHVDSYEEDYDGNNDCYFDEDEYY